MATQEQTETDAQRAKREAKEAKDAERAAKAEAKAKADAEKAKAREAEKERKAKEAAEAKVKREQEAIVKILAELPEDRRPTGDELVATDRAKARELVKAFKAEERANRPKKASLTLSQRRAMIKLGEGPIVPKTGFNALPLDYLVSVGLAQTETVNVEETYQETESREVEIPEAERTEGGPTTKTERVKVDKTRTVEKAQYSLTDTGKERVKEINPKWRDWKPAATETTETPAEDAA